MTQKGKSPIEQATRAASALLKIEEWNLEAQRADVDRRRSLLESVQPTSDWSMFVFANRESAKREYFPCVFVGAIR